MTTASESDDGGPAFPKTHDPYPNVQGLGTPSHEGMSLRDWFAGQAIGSVVKAMMSGDIGDHPVTGGGPHGFAATAYDIADAMIAARAALENVRGG